MPHSSTTTFSLGVPPVVPAFSISSSAAAPRTSRPNTTCVLSRCGCGPKATKNWEELECGLDDAIESVPASLCVWWKPSSLNVGP